MQFIYSDPQTEFERLIGGFHFINAFGQIEADDASKFERFLEASAPPPRTTIYIDSSGGDVDAAIKIGRLIRAGWFSTSIGRCHLRPSVPITPIFERKFLSGKCMSAATLIFLGGRLRYFSEGSDFGVHQFSFKNPSPADVNLSQTLSARIARYISDMGISAAFLEISSSTPSSSISLIDEEQLRNLFVVTDGQTEVQWSMQAKNRMLYVRGERDSLYGHHKVMLCHTRGTGFLFWAVIEPQGREQQLTDFSIVEIVVNGEEIRINISDRCTRFIMGMYVNILAVITQEEARLIAFSDSFGIQVRFSIEAEMFLGIGAMSTDGGSDQLETLFHSFCDEPCSQAEPR